MYRVTDSTMAQGSIGISVGAAVGVIMAILLIVATAIITVVVCLRHKKKSRRYFNVRHCDLVTAIIIRKMIKLSAYLRNNFCFQCLFIMGTVYTH